MHRELIYCWIRYSCTHTWAPGGRWCPGWPQPWGRSAPAGKEPAPPLHHQTEPLASHDKTEPSSIPSSNLTIVRLIIEWTFVHSNVKLKHCPLHHKLHHHPFYHQTEPSSIPINWIIVHSIIKLYHHTLLHQTQQLFPQCIDLKVHMSWCIFEWEKYI